MRTNYRSPQFQITPAIRAHSEARMATLKARHGDHVREMEIRFADLNGPKGGVDKLCRLQARIDGHPSVHAEGRDEDLYTAINLAFQRMERTLDRTLDGARGRREGCDGLLEP